MFLIGYLVAAVVGFLIVYFLIDMSIANNAVKDIQGPTFRSILMKMIKRDKGKASTRIHSVMDKLVCGKLNKCRRIKPGKIEVTFVK
jgi:hypothetical protein